MINPAEEGVIRVMSEPRFNIKASVKFNDKASVKVNDKASGKFVEDTREGLNGEYLSKSVLRDDDSTKQELLPEHTSLSFSSEDIDCFYDSADSDSDDFDNGAAMLPNLKDEFVDGLLSSCGNEQIIVSTTDHRDRRDAALLPMDTYIHKHELNPRLNHNQSMPIQLSDSMVFDSSWAMPALSSGSDHSDRIYSLGHNLELVDGLSSSCGDERITGSTTKLNVLNCRRTSQTWTTTTSNLVDDGYAWRKYAQKHILNATFARSYYRCAHKFDQGCQATKQVQRTDEDPSIYQITYRGNHSCRDPPKAPHIILDSTIPNDSSNSNFTSFRPTHYPNSELKYVPSFQTFPLVKQKYSHNQHELNPRLNHNQSMPIQLSDSMVFDSSWAMPALSSGSDHSDRIYSLGHNLELVDGLSSSCGDERITGSTTNHRDLHDAALLPLVNMDTDIRTASPQPIALPDGGEIVQLESSEQKSLVDFDATNNRAYHSSILMSSEKKNLIEACKGRWESLIQRTEKDMGEGLNEECLIKRALCLDDSTEQNSVDPRRGRGRFHSMERKQPATFAELGTDPEYEGIVSYLLKFVREKDFYKWVGKAWKRGYLLYDPSFTNRLSLMAYMSNRLEFDIHNLDLTGLSSIEELMNMLVSIRNHSSIAIKDFDHWVGMFPNVKSESASSSRWPVGLPDGAHIVPLDPSKQSTQTIVHVAGAEQCSPTVSLPEKKMVRTLKRKYRTISVIVENHQQHQSIALPDGGEIVQLDSSVKKTLVDFDATTNWGFQSGILLSYSKRRCMTLCGVSGFYSTDSLARKSFEVLETLLPLEQLRNSVDTDRGGQIQTQLCVEPSDACGSHPIHMDTRIGRFWTYLCPSLCYFFCIRSIFWEEPNDFVPLLSPRRLTFKGCVQLEKSPYLPGLLQIDGVQKGLITSPRYLGGSTAKKWATRKGYSLGEKRPYEVSSQSMDEKLVSKFLFIHMSQFPTFSPLPLALPNSSEIVGPIALSSDEFAATNNRAHLVRQNQCGSTASHYKRKNTRETLGRQRITESLSSIEDLQQHFARKHKDAVKRLGVKVSIFKSSCRQHRVYWLPCQIIKSEQQAFDATSNIAHVVKADQGIPTVSCSEMENKRESLKRECSGLSLEDLPEHYGGRHEDAMKGLGEKKMVRRTLKRKYRIMSLIFSIHQQHFGKRSEGTAKSFHAMRICRNHGINCVSMVKCIHKQHGINQWPFRQKWATRKGHSLGEKRPYEVSTLSMDMPRSLKLDCSRGLGAQFAVGLPDGGYVLSVSEKKIVEKTLKRKCKTMSLFSLEDDQQHGVRRWGDAAKSLGRKRICRQLVVQHVSRAKRIHRQHVFHRWPFQQNWETMKAYSVRDKRPAEVLSLSTDGKLVSRLQLVHISWLVKFLPRPSAYGGGGEIVGPIALLSSEFAATNNRAHGIRNDQSGSSSASHFEEEIPGEPVDVEGTGSGISLEELQQLFDKKREDAAKSLKVSVSTFKRICRQHGIKPWPYQARKKAVKKPPDRHRGMNTTGSSDDQRNLSASQEEPLLRGHVSGPIYRTIPTCTDPAPGQPTPIVPHPTGNLLASEEEVLLRGHVSGPIYGRISSRTDPAPSQTTPIVPHPTGNLEDQRNLLALPEELLLSQRTPSIHPAMDGFAYWGDGSALFDDFFPEGHASGSLDCAAPACSNPAPSQTMPTNATEMQNMDFVELKATYDDATFGNTTIKFQLPPKFETSELEEKVSKILKCELDSFRVEYKDKDEEWILMGCDENVREYLQLLNSLGNQVTKLKITKVPNTNLCEACGSSLTRKRPRHV